MDSKSSDKFIESQPFSMKNHDQTVLSYRKLKFSFMCMLVLNALLLGLVITCMILIVPRVTNGSTKHPESQPLTESAYLKCLMIQNKLKRLYKNGQMVDEVHDEDKCSMEDLLDSFIQHVEDSMKKADKSTVSSAFHLVSNNTDISRCSDSRTLYCLKKWKLSVNTTKIAVNDEAIIVPSGGIYFLYSRVVINAKLGHSLKETDMVSHSIRYSNSGKQFMDLETNSIKCGVIQNTMSHISYIEKIQYLEEGSLIKVAMDLPRDVSMQPSIGTGAFGMFKL